MTERSDDLQRVGRMAEMGLLSAALMHELRQPILAIQAVAELAIAGGASDEKRWRRVLDQVGLLRSLVDHHGGFARHDGPVSRVDLRGPARRALETVRPRAKQARVRLALDLPQEAAWVRARESSLWQVLVNLVLNGVDASEGQPDAEVRTVIRCEEGAWRVEVLDVGCGLPQDAEPLFEPFVTRKEEGRGTGLGLFIARALVTEAGGELRLTPRDGGVGAQALVMLPRVD